MKKRLNPAWLYLIVAIALIPCCGMTPIFSNQLERVFLCFGIGIRCIDTSFSSLQIGSFVFMKRHIPNLIYLSTMIYFVITLFRNKYNTNLFLAVCSFSFVKILFSLLYNGAYYQFLTVLNILLYITITILTAIKMYSTKHLFKHLWIFPPLLKLIMFFWNCGNLSKPILWHWSMAGCFLFLSRYPIYYIGIAVAVIDIIATALFSYNLVSETASKQKNQKNQKHINMSANEEYSAYCGMAKHILLCLFTFGIWQYIWIWRTTKFLNQAPKAEQYNPTKKLLLCMFVPFYMIYWLYKHGQRIDAMYKDKNLGNSDMATLCLILGIFIPIVAYIIMQDKINTLCTVETNEVNEDINENKEINFEDLNKLKDLLDNNIITQEEFEQKKKQLLGL